VFADDSGNLTERNALFSNPVKSSLGSRGLLNCKPKQMGSINSVHRRPAIQSLAFVD